MKRQNYDRDKWLHVRLSAIEHKELSKKMANSTCRNLSEYTRNVLFNHPIISTYRNRSQDDMVRKLALLNNELNAIGNNLNQVTKSLHTLQVSERHHWGLQFSSQAEGIILQVVEVKQLIQEIAQRWLR